MYNFGCGCLPSTWLPLTLTALNLRGTSSDLNSQLLSHCVCMCVRECVRCEVWGRWSCMRQTHTHTHKFSTIHHWWRVLLLGRIWFDWFRSSAARQRTRNGTGPKCVWANTSLKSLYLSHSLESADKQPSESLKKRASANHVPVRRLIWDRLPGRDISLVLGSSPWTWIPALYLEPGAAVQMMPETISLFPTLLKHILGE